MTRLLCHYPKLGAVIVWLACAVMLGALLIGASGCAGSRSSLRAAAEYGEGGPVARCEINLEMMR